MPSQIIGAADFQLYNATYGSTAEIVTPGFRSHPSATQTNIFVRSTQSGTLDLDVQMTDGTWIEIYSNGAVVANNLFVVSHQFRLPLVRARFTPSAAPGTERLVVDAGYAGHAFG